MFFFERLCVLLITLLITETCLYLWEIRFYMQYPAVEINPTALRCLYVMSNIWLPNNLITGAISQLLQGHEAMLQKKE